MAFYKKDQPKHIHSKSPYKKQIAEIAKLAKYEPVPSILPQHNDFNFTLLENGQLRRKIKQQIYAQPNSFINSRKQYSPSHPKTSPRNKKIEHHPTNTSQNYEHLLTVDTRVDTEEPLVVVSRNRSLSPSIIIDQEERLFFQKQKELKARIQQRNYNSLNQKNRYEDKIAQQQEETQEETQYEYDTTPGPGYYNVNSSTFQSSNVSRVSLKNRSGVSNFSFGSKAQRFIINPQKDIKVEDSRVRRLHKKDEIRRKKQIQAVKFKKIIIPFGAGSPKFSYGTKEEFPSPQDYRIRSGIQEQLIQKIQRNFKGHFGVVQQRFKPDKPSHLGPGTYNILQEQQPQHTIGSYYFASEKKRFE